MSVLQILDRMEDLSGQFASVGASGSNGNAATIIGLRQEFATECGNLLKAMCDDQRIFADRQLFGELQTSLENMRARMATHQLKWQRDRVEQDLDAYRKASEGMNAVVENFINDAREKISA